MPLLEPEKSKWQEAENTQPTQSVQAKTDNLRSALAKMFRRLSHMHVPNSLKGMGHNIWYGPRKTTAQLRPLRPYRWNWQGYKKKHRR